MSAPAGRARAGRAAVLAFGLALAAGIDAPARADHFNCETMQGSEETEIISFDGRSARILASEGQRLDRLARVAREQRLQRICVIGHASRSGDARANERLARQRAEAVIAELARRGVSRNVMQAAVQGEAFGGVFGFLRSDNRFDRTVNVVFLQP